MGGKLGLGLILGGAVCLSCLAAEEEKEPAKKAAAPAKAPVVMTPPYRIILRSRSGEVIPERTRFAQTGSGYIDVVQRDPATIMAIMRGAVVAGTEKHEGGKAALHFVLDQTFDIVPTRDKLSPPQLMVTSTLTGTLNSTRPVGGSAEQGPACFAILCGGQPLLTSCIKPHAVGPCQDLFVSEREGTFEVPVAPGGYCLHQNFDLSAETPPHHCLCPYQVPAAGAVFGVDPKLDNRWNYVFAPFRAVPHQNFGFGVLIRVREDTSRQVESLPEPIPVPRKMETTTQLPDKVEPTTELPSLVPNRKEPITELPTVNPDQVDWQAFIRQWVSRGRQSPE